MKKIIVYLAAIYLIMDIPKTMAEQIWGEAEDALSITAPLEVINDVTASGGRYIAVVPGNNSTGSPPSTGVAKYRIRVKEGGVYIMYLRVLCSPDVDADSSDSCWVRIQGATLNLAVAADGWIRNNNIDYQVSNAQQWFWSQVRHYEAWPGDDFVEFTLSPGTYTVEIAYREDGLWIDGFMLTNDPEFDPQTLPDVIPFVPGDISSNPRPANGESNVARDTVLSWTPGEFAKTHNLYIGTDFDDVNDATASNPLGTALIKGLDICSYDPKGGLEWGTTYYWRVDEVNGAPDYTVYKGRVWSFTVEPYSYPVTPIVTTASGSYRTNTDPVKTIDGSGLTNDGHDTIITNMWVSQKGFPIWIQYEFDKLYKLDKVWIWNSNQAIEPMIGYGAKDVEILCSEDGQDWQSLGQFESAQAPGEAGYTPNTTINLNGVMARYVKFDIKSSWGGLNQASISEVRFFQIPLAAFSPEPADGSIDVAVDAVLNWRVGRLAARHQVYIDTDRATVEAGTATSKTVTDHRLSLAAVGAEYDRTYYWRVDEVNDAASPAVIPGDIWSFSTAVYGVVDDFESYNDACKRIFFAWADGLGHSGSTNCGVPAFTGNGTGSAVGNNAPPFAERTMVHSGRQSMPFAYQGLSEATRTFDTAQDWTVGGIKYLVLYFRGETDNAAGQLYLKINNTQVQYTGNVDAIRLGVWKQWAIPLAGIPGLGSVRSLTIGVNSTGSGKLYIDDIRLYREAPQEVLPVDPGVNGLAAWYSFEGNCQDVSGKGLHGTAVNDPTYVPGKVGQAISLDGTNDYVELPIGNLISGLDSMTVSTWVNWSGLTGNWQRIFDFGTGTTMYMFMAPSASSGTTGLLRFAITTGSSSAESQLSGPATLPTGWHHLAVVIDGTSKQMWLYLDGEMVDTDTTSTLPRDLGVTNQNWLGRSQWEADAYYNGQIDEFRIYNRALSPAEVRYLAGDRP